MSTTTQDQTTVLALEDIQQRLGQQLKANQEQTASLQAELQEQHVKLSQVQVHAQQVRSEISTWQTQHRANELDVKRAQQDLEHARGSSLEASRMERLTAADSAHKKSKHELAILTTQLEKDTQEESRLTEQVQALTAKLTDLAAARDELTASSSRLSLELCEAIKERELEALRKVQTEIDRLQASLTEAYGYYDKCLAQAAQHLAPWPAVATAVIAEHIRVETDTLPAIVAAKAQLQLAQVEAERGPAVRWGDDASTFASARIQIQQVEARIETLRQQVRERAAQELLKQTSLV